MALTSLMAFFLSGMAGGLVAQQLAVVTGAHEEFIPVFMMSALVTILATVAFFIAQFVSRRAVNMTGICGVVFLVVAGAALFGWARSQHALGQAGAGDLPVIAGLVLPGIATIIVHWLFVRWRNGGAASGFGRGGARA